MHNRGDDPALSTVRSGLAADLKRLLSETGAVPDRMTVDQGIKADLPDAKIR